MTNPNNRWPVALTPRAFTTPGEAAEFLAASGWKVSLDAATAPAGGEWPSGRSFKGPEELAEALRALTYTVTAPTTGEGDGGVGYGDSYFVGHQDLRFKHVDNAVDWLRTVGWTVTLDLVANAILLPESWDAVAVFTDSDALAKAVSLYGFTCTAPNQTTAEPDTFTAEEVEAGERVAMLAARGFGGPVGSAGKQPMGWFRVTWIPDLAAGYYCEDVPNVREATELAGKLLEAGIEGVPEVRGPDGFHAYVTGPDHPAIPDSIPVTVDMTGGKLADGAVEAIMATRAEAKAGRKPCDCIGCRLSRGLPPAAERRMPDAVAALMLALSGTDRDQRPDLKPTDADLKGKARPFMGLDLSSKADTFASGVGFAAGGFVTVRGHMSEALLRVIKALHAAGTPVRDIQAQVDALQSMDPYAPPSKRVAELVEAGRLSHVAARAYEDLPQLDDLLKGEEHKRFSIEEVSRLFGVPAALLTDPPYSGGKFMGKGRLFVGDLGTESIWPTGHPLAFAANAKAMAERLEAEADHVKPLADRGTMTFMEKPRQTGKSVGPLRVDLSGFRESLEEAAADAFAAVVRQAILDDLRKARQVKRPPWWVRAHRAGREAVERLLAAPVTWENVVNIAVLTLILAVVAHFGGGVLAYILSGGGQ